MALRRAIDLGVNLIDTALAYGDGHSEELVGQVVREAGRKIYVATKVPPKNRIWPATAASSIGDVFPYDYILACAEESLRNLGWRPSTCCNCTSGPTPGWSATSGSARSKT